MSTNSAGLSTAAVAPQVVYAGWWRRGWALLFDWLILGFATGIADMAGESPMQHVADLLSFAFVVGYVVLLTATGGTPGKRVLGMRVVRMDGTPAGVWKALGRELLKPITAIPLGLGWLWMLDEPDARTWHDLAAGTVVIRELPGTRRPSWSEQPPWQRASRPPEHEYRVAERPGDAATMHAEAAPMQGTPRVDPPPPPPTEHDSADHDGERD